MSRDSEAQVSPEIFKNWRRTGFKRTSSSTRLKQKKGLKINPSKLERVRRVELPTLCLASIRSSQLSYTRIVIRGTLMENELSN